MEILGLIWIPTWLLLVIALIVTYCIYMCKDFGIFKTMGVPGPTPLPVIGNFYPYFTLGILEGQIAWYKKYGRVFGVNELNNPVLFIGDPEMLREILVKQFHNFPNRRSIARQQSPLNKMVSLLEDAEWKHVRTIMTPTFSSGKLKKMASLINRACDKFVSNLTQTAENNEDIEIKKACATFSLDVIGNVAFGIETNSQDNPEDPMVVHARAFFNIGALGVILIVFLPKLLPLFQMLPSPQKRAAKYFQQLVKETFRQRKEDAEKRNDFLQLMMNADEEARKDANVSNNKTDTVNEDRDLNRKGLTMEEITAQSIIFFLGGLETLASTLAMLFYSLAQHQDILDKALEEIDTVLGKDECITYEQAGKLHYLEQAICETQRLYPAAARVDRICSATTTIKGITIPKGMIVTVPINCIHLDEEFWPEPEKFDPDRFRPEVKGDINPFTFLPFGYGPRNCIAMRLALLEMKVAAARVLQKLRPFKVSRTQVVENHDDSCEDDENEMMHITLMTNDLQTPRPSIAVLKDRMQRTGTARVQFIQTHSTDEILEIFVQYKYLKQYKYPTFTPFPVHCVDLIVR